LHILSATSKIINMQDPEETTNAAQPRPDTVSALDRGIALLRCFTETRR